jgi:hypothetical protein
MNSTLHLRRALGAFVLLLAPLPALAGNGAPPPLRAALATFAVHPTVGMPSGASRTAEQIKEVVGDLKTTLVLFEDGDSRLCFVTSSFGINEPKLNTFIRALVAKQLGYTSAEVVAATSHNHTVPLLELGVGGVEANELGREFLAGLNQAVAGLRARLEPVTVEWGVTREERITYNRRGRRADGRSYFIREEDRQLLDPGYVGTIDPDATVVLLRALDGRPAGAIGFFTGHPVTGYNPERMAAHGQWSQVACEKLSAHLGGVPVAFIQGCCGDINSKYMLTGTIQQAIEAGQLLGDSFIAATKNLRPSRRMDFTWQRAKVTVPQAPLPPLADLQRDLASIDDFIRRGRQGDENTLECVGMNFPRALTPNYRAQLVSMVRPWYVWAEDQRRSGLADQLKPGLPLEVVVARIGDVGYVGMPFEAFVKIGLRIKREAALPCVLTGGYTDGSFGYIPDASATADREYMGGFFRYLPERLPYTGVGGEAVAEVAVPILADFAK